MMRRLMAVPVAAAVVLLAIATGRAPEPEVRTAPSDAPVLRRVRPPVIRTERRRSASRVASAGKWQTWTASWYGEESGSVTASGEPFRPGALTAAHRSLPIGTRLQVCNGDRCVVVRINDRGPYVRGRDLDLSRGAAEALDMIEAGVAPVRVRVVGEE